MSFLCDLARKYTLVDILELFFPFFYKLHKSFLGDNED